MKIEVHLLQNFAPSCLNRDDTNTPKTCEFGGVTRARVSSQCFKKAVRNHFATLGIEKGTRSKRIKEALAETLIPHDAAAQELYEALAANRQPESEATLQLSAALTLFVEAYYSEMSAMDGNRQHETKVLLYWSGAELQEAAVCFQEERPALNARVPELIAFLRSKTEPKAGKGKKGVAAKAEDADAKTDGDDSKKPKHPASRKIAGRLQQAALTPDIALFGRMLASNPDTNIDAACQVAHAISTHSANLEMDFFTAVDDLNLVGTTGAGMLGVTGYDSACFYRYSLMDFAQLMHNLGNSRERAEEAVAGFLQSFVQAIPTGKQNSMAAQNLPSLVLFVVREHGTPCSLVNAFARPINPVFYQQDLVGGSIAELAAYWQRLNKMYGLDRGATLALSHDRDERDEKAKQETKTLLGTLADFDKGSLDAGIAATMDAVRGLKAEVAP